MAERLARRAGQRVRDRQLQLDACRRPRSARGARELLVAEARGHPMNLTRPSGARNSRHDGRRRPAAGGHLGARRGAGRVDLWVDPLRRGRCRGGQHRDSPAGRRSMSRSPRRSSGLRTPTPPSSVTGGGSTSRARRAPPPRARAEFPILVAFAPARSRSWLCSLLDSSLSTAGYVALGATIVTMAWAAGTAARRTGADARGALAALGALVIGGTLIAAKVPLK